MGRFSAALANTSPLPFSRQKSANPGDSWAKPYAATFVAAYPQTQRPHAHLFSVCMLIFLRCAYDLFRYVYAH